MKIFRMNDFDWWMDLDLESAKKNYLKHIGQIGDPEDEQIDDARELTETELDNYRFVNDEEGKPDCTFREQLEKIEKIQQFFASTEY